MNRNLSLVFAGFIFLFLSVLCHAGEQDSVVVVSAAEARAMLDSGTPMLFVDVREPSDYSAGHIDDATNMPWYSGVLQANHEQLPDLPLVIYCASGYRSGLASTFLIDNGHSDIYNMSSGYSSWTLLETRTPTPSPTETPTATATPSADLNDDGVVDEEDLILFLANWQKQ